MKRMDQNCVVNGSNNGCIALLYAKILFLVLIFTTVLTESESMASNKEYSINRRSDGGYTVDLTINKRHWKPITAEGFFPKQRMHFIIEVIGKGKDWSKIDQKGYYYSSEKVVSKGTAWDLGYAWVDIERKFLYLNFYWASSPDGLIPSEANGKYELPR